jgi:hypothetical protein
MESSAKTRLPLHSIVFVILRRHSASLSNFGIILHSYIICQKGREFEKGSYFTHKYPFLEIHAKGEKVLAQRRTAPPCQFQNFPKQSLSVLKCSSIGIPLRNSILFGMYILKEGVFQLVSYF